MKVFFAITFLCAVLSVSVTQPVTREEAEQTFKTLAASCVDKTGATADDLEQLVKHQPFKTKEGKCLSECIMKQFNTLSKDGELNKSTLMQFAELILNNDQEKINLAEKIIDSCLHIKNDDHCELAAEFETCLHKGIRESDLSIDW